MAEYTFALCAGDRTAIVTVEADDYESAEQKIQEIRDRDFPGRIIEDYCPR